MLYGARVVENDSLDEWTRIADLSFPLGRGSTVTIAELESCLWGVTCLNAWLSGQAALDDHIAKWQPLSTDSFEVLELSGLL